MEVSNRAELIDWLICQQTCNTYQHTQWGMGWNDAINFVIEHLEEPTYVQTDTQKEELTARQERV